MNSCQLDCDQIANYFLCFQNVITIHRLLYSRFRRIHPLSAYTHLPVTQFNMAKYPKRKNRRHNKASRALTKPLQQINKHIYKHNNKPDKHQKQPIKYKKKKIPLAVRQSVWIKQFGRVFQHKCFVSWCHRVLSCFDFEVGHNIPESKGGTLDLTNLYPICHQCNTGMGNQYTIMDWSNRKFN
jgi:5-methylcytosine-specific restriction endonuclease McrA